MTVKKHKNGKWMARVSYKDEDGSFKQKSKYTFQTKKEAQLWEQATLDEIENGVDYTTLPFHAYFLNWFETYKKQKVSEATCVNYMATYAKLKEFFKNKQMNDITGTEYQRFLNHYGKKLAIGTMQKINKHIRACVSDAIHNKELQIDFTYKSEVTGKESKAESLKYLNESEAKSLIESVKSNLTEGNITSHMILLAISTGMRFGELAALTFDNLNYADSTISINKSWSGAERKFRPTKNKTNRIIKVEASMMASLKERKQFYFTLGIRNPNNFVFCGVDGKPPTNAAANKALQRACKRAGIQAVTFHALRHTHASILLFNGMDLSSIARRLGHQSTTTTADHYAHIIAEHQNKADQLSDKVVRRLFAK